ncbi:MAG: hypothetical protein AAB512_04665 [Patescibacteria group bacterium]
MLPDADNRSLERYIEASKLWCRKQRDLYRPLASPLSLNEKTIYGSFFPEEVIEEARFVQLNEGLESPQADPGSPIKFSLSAMMAFTFVDTVVETPLMPRSEAAIRRVRFHELVHVTQVRAFGEDAVVEQYLRSWSRAGYNYWEIPFEAQARNLERAFMKDPTGAFSVDKIVRDNAVSQ